jgi:hypothetical protein
LPVTCKAAVPGFIAEIGDDNNLAFRILPKGFEVMVANRSFPLKVSNDLLIRLSAGR